MSCRGGRVCRCTTAAAETSSAGTTRFGPGKSTSSSSRGVHGPLASSGTTRPRRFRHRPSGPRATSASPEVAQPQPVPRRSANV